MNDRDWINALLGLPSQRITPAIEAQNLRGSARFDQELAMTMRPHALERLVEMGAPVPSDTRVCEVDGWLAGFTDRRKRGLASPSIAMKLCHDYGQTVDEVRDLSHEAAVALVERLGFERGRPGVIAKQRAALEALLGSPDVKNTDASPASVQTLRAQLGRLCGLGVPVAVDVASDDEIVAWSVDLSTREQRGLASFERVLELVGYGVDPSRARRLSRGEAGLLLMQCSADRCERLAQRTK